MRVLGLLGALTIAAASPVLAEAAKPASGAFATTDDPALACAPDRAVFRLQDGRSHVFEIELARTAAERAQGLMYREALAPDDGMLFIYPHAQPVAFWMRNTLIALDMIFIAADGEVLRVHERAIPHDETPIESGAEVRFVLEIAGGRASEIGLRRGAVLRHPAITPPAVWACTPG